MSTNTTEILLTKKTTDDMFAPKNKKLKKKHNNNNTNSISAASQKFILHENCSESRIKVTDKNYEDLVSRNKIGFASITNDDNEKPPYETFK